MINNSISNKPALEYVQKIYAITTTIDGITTTGSNVDFFKGNKDKAILSIPELNKREVFLDSVAGELENTKKEIGENQKLSTIEVKIITDLYDRVVYKVERARHFILEALDSRENFDAKLNQAFEVRNALTSHLGKYVQATYKKGADSIFLNQGIAVAAAKVGVLSEVIARIDHITKEQIKEYSDKLKSVAFPGDLELTYKQIVEARNQIEKEINEFGVEVESFKALFVDLKRNHEEVVYKDQIAKEKWFTDSTEQFDEELEAVIGEKKAPDSKFAVVTYYYSAAKSYAQSYFKLGSAAPKTEAPGK